MTWDEDFERWLRRMQRLWRTPFIGFRGIEEMDKIFDEMFREMTKNIPNELIKEKKLPNGGSIKEHGPFIYGYSMTIGPDGKPIIREFGNVKPSTKRTSAGYHKPSLQYNEGREPLVDIFEDDTTIRIIAEVPGVDKEDIELTCTEQRLIISVDTEMRKYYKEIDLVTPVDPKGSKAKYKNGVLQVTLPKIKRKASTGEKIRLD
jgi:HSP20 family protein